MEEKDWKGIFLSLKQSEEVTALLEDDKNYYNPNILKFLKRMKFLENEIFENKAPFQILYIMNQFDRMSPYYGYKDEKLTFLSTEIDDKSFGSLLAKLEYPYEEVYILLHDYKNIFLNLKTSISCLIAKFDSSPSVNNRFGLGNFDSMYKILKFAGNEDKETETKEALSSWFKEYFRWLTI